MPASLFALILSALYFAATLAPLTNERAALAVAIARVVHADAPFYRNDDDRRRTLALHVAVAFREGTLQTSVVGDGGHSYCAFQIHDSSGGTRALTMDPDACAAAGHAMLRTSIRVCREHPVAWYAEGPHGCESRRAQRISADRVDLAERLLTLSL